MSSKKTSLLVALLLIAFTPVLAQSGWSVDKSIHVGGTGGWDYLTVDSHRLYVPRGTHTQVLDTEGKVIFDVPGQKRAHGVAIANGRGFITDGGGDGAIMIFDIKSGETLGTLAAKPDTDGIIYDPASKLVLAVSGDEGLLMTVKPDVDPKSGKIDAPIELGGKPEFLAADGKGKVFINLQDKNEVAAVDIAARKVIARWPVAPGGAPVGISIDPQAHRLFIGCRNPAKFIVMSTDDGKVIADFPIGPGVDATKFNKGEAFASSADGTLAVVKETSKDKFELVQTVKTPAGARTMGVDLQSNTIYMPTAEFEPQAAGARGRPAAKPDSFMIVVVKKK